jgi:hypothetical protein
VCFIFEHSFKNIYLNKYLFHQKRRFSTIRWKIALSVFCENSAPKKRKDTPRGRFFKNGDTSILPKVPDLSLWRGGKHSGLWARSPITAMAVVADFHRAFLFDVPTRHNRPARYSFEYIISHISALVKQFASKLSAVEKDIAVARVLLGYGNRAGV